MRIYVRLRGVFPSVCGTSSYYVSVMMAADANSTVACEVDDVSFE